MSGPTKTPDGYDMCPECGHHTSAAVGGHCTALVPLFADGEFDGVRYCNCDCYKALHGVSLMDKIFAPDPFSRIPASDSSYAGTVLETPQERENREAEEADE
jgi:hypothetical protein